MESDPLKKIQKNIMCYCPDCHATFLSDRMPIPEHKPSLFSFLSSHSKKDAPEDSAPEDSVMKSHLVSVESKGSSKSSFPCPKCGGKNVTFAGISD